jgi:hypothetical protein
MLPAVDEQHPVGRDDGGMSKRSSTAVATLLTFWPPGPDARTKRSSRWRSSSTMVSVMRIMGLETRVPS